jgi:hypothetical protein
MQKKNEVEIKFFGNKEKILSIFTDKLKLKASIKEIFDEYKFSIKISFDKPKTPAEIKKWLLESPWENFLYGNSESE